jgi:tetratricopeptide (TPR) repeat protein
MPAIKKDKLIAICFCILICGFILLNFISIAQAQRQSIDETLISLTSKGKVYIEKGDIANASKKIQEAYEKAIKEKSSLNTAVLNDLSEVLFKVGEAVFNKDGAGNAESWVEKSIDMNNRNDESHLLLARIYYDEKDYSKAISSIIMANNIKQRPNNYLLLAFTYLHTKSYQNAIEACNEGLKKEPTSKEVSALLNMRGFVYNVLGDQEQAKKDYLDAYKKDNGNEAAKNNYENLKKLES